MSIFGRTPYGATLYRDCAFYSQYQEHYMKCAICPIILALNRLSALLIQPHDPLTLIHTPPISSLVANDHLWLPPHLLSLMGVILCMLPNCPQVWPLHLATCIMMIEDPLYQIANSQWGGRGDRSGGKINVPRVYSAVWYPFKWFIYAWYVKLFNPLWGVITDWAKNYCLNHGYMHVLSFNWVIL